MSSPGHGYQRDEEQEGRGWACGRPACSHTEGRRCRCIGINLESVVSGNQGDTAGRLRPAEPALGSDTRREGTGPRIPASPPAAKGWAHKSKNWTQPKLGFAGWLWREEDRPHSRRKESEHIGWQWTLIRKQGCGCQWERLTSQDQVQKDESHRREGGDQGGCWMPGCPNNRGSSRGRAVEGR